MSRSCAVRSGFAAVSRQPMVYLCELAWRWSFALSAVLLTWWALRVFLDSLPVTNRDAFGLSGIVPGLYAQALSHVFQGSGFKLVRIVAALAPGLTLLWWLAASVGRTATLEALTSGALFSEENDVVTGSNVRGVFTLQALRVLVAFIACIAFVGAFALATSVGGYGERIAEARHVNAAKFYFVLLPLWSLVSMIWSTGNWYLSLATVLYVVERRNVVDAIHRAAQLSRSHAGQFAWTGFVIAALRIVVLIVAWFASLGMIGMAIGLPALGLACIALVVISYSAVASLFHLMKLAAYMRIIAWDKEPPPIVQSELQRVVVEPVIHPEPTASPQLPSFEQPPAPAV